MPDRKGLSFTELLSQIHGAKRINSLTHLSVALVEAGQLLYEAGSLKKPKVVVFLNNEKIPVNKDLVEIFLGEGHLNYTTRNIVGIETPVLTPTKSAYHLLDSEIERHSDSSFTSFANRSRTAIASFHEALKLARSRSATVRTPELGNERTTLERKTQDDHKPGPEHDAVTIIGVIKEICRPKEPAIYTLAGQFVGGGNLKSGLLMQELGCAERVECKVISKNHSFAVGAFGVFGLSPASKQGSYFVNYFEPKWREDKF